MKNVLKRSLSLLLAFTLVFGSAVVGFGEVDWGNLFTVKANAASLNDLTFKLNDAGTGYVVTDCDEEVTGEIVIPNTYLLVPVVEIGTRAFEDCEYITKVSLPDSIKNIREYAFYCCRGLTEIEIPTSVVSIGKSAFSCCTKLSSFKINNGLKSIGNQAFECCYSLTSVNLPNSITSIGDNAFLCCSSLAEITVGSLNTTYASIDGVLYNKAISDMLWVPNAYTGSFVMPDTVTSISGPGFDSCKFLTHVKVSNKLTELCDYMFTSCESLVSVDLPDTITKIGECAFAYCENLTAIEIPNNVESIGAEAFCGCANLREVIVPASVKTLGTGAFETCTALKNIYLEGCNVIGFGAFFCCESLASITLPKELKTIEEYAFYSCTSLATVNYSGTEEQWNNITIGSDNESLHSANVIFNYTGKPEPSEPEPVEPEPPEEKPIEGTFKVAYDSEYKEFDYSYSNSYFDKPTIEYNHKLATMSLSLALSGYQCKDVKITYDNVRNLLDECGFKKEFGRAYNYTYSTTPDDVGCYISRKNIGDKTVIAVVVRSSGYDKEWASNLTVGVTGDHQGFDEASDIVLNRIKSYIKENEISGDVKFWLTGYSRGAATATHTAAKLNYTKIDGVNFTKNEIYAYGFATPAGAINSSDLINNELYENIFNIINFHDLVPRVAPRIWGFGRYGKTFYLPFSDSSTECHNKEDYVKKWFKEKGLSYKLDDFVAGYSESNGENSYKSNDTLGVFISKLIDDIAISIGSRAKYVDRLQPKMRGISIQESNVTKLSLILKELKSLLLELFTVNLEYVETALETGTNLFEAHAKGGAYYLGWMQTIPDDLTEEEYKKQGYFNAGVLRKFIYNCPVDVYVYNTSGNLIAAIENDIPVEIEGASFSYGVDENGQKYFYLPVDGEYNITVKAREDCETTCTVNEFSDGSSIESRVVTFTEIPMKEGEEISASTEAYSESDIVNGTENGSSVDYTVQRENEEVIEADVDVSGEEIENYTFNVTVEYDENKGTVYGGGSFTIGQFCQVTAENKPGYRFSKWTVNGETVSTESTYRFGVKEDVTMVAEYVPCEHPDSVISDWIIDADATVHASGSKHKECTVCGEIMGTVVLPQLKPATPKLTKVSRTASGVKVSWGAVEGADSYIVYRKTSKSGWTNLGTTTESTFTDTKAKTGTTYYYTVKAQNEAGASGYNKTGLKIKFVAAPKLTKIANESSGVRVKWSKVSGADGYYLYRRVAGSKTWTKVATIKKGSTTSYLDKKASAGKTYEYIIKCYDGSTPSASAAKVIKIKRLTVPKLVSAKSAKAGVTVKWGKVAGAEGYLVYRKTGKGSWGQFTKVEGNAKVSFVDKSAKKGKTYTYTVRAYSSSYKSAYNTKGLSVKDKY